MKLLLNSILSIPGAKIITMDIKNFYLEIDLKEKQYVFISAELVPEEIIIAYNLYSKMYNSNICIQMNKGIYSLKEARSLAN